MSIEFTIDLKGRGIFGGNADISELADIMNKEYQGNAKFEPAGDGSFSGECKDAAAAEDILELVIGAIEYDTIQSWLDKNRVQFRAVEFESNY